MKQNNVDRSLDGKEREKERIALKQFKNQAENFELNLKLMDNEIEKIQLQKTQLQVQLDQTNDRLSQSKRLVAGEKISEVFPELKQIKKEKPKTEEAKNVKHNSDDKKSN